MSSYVPALTMYHTSESDHFPQQKLPQLICADKIVSVDGLDRAQLIYGSLWWHIHVNVRWISVKCKGV
jgi:hypothetical protein